MDTIRVDLGRGVADIAGTEVAVALGPGGSLVVGGGVVRPLTYGERSAAVGWALGCPDPREAAVAAVRSAAVESTVKSLPGELVDVLALALAGAGTEAGTPGFVESALLVIRATGWRADELESTRAGQVDELARSLREPAADDGWTRLAFGRPGSEADTPAALRATLADDLVRRARQRPGEIGTTDGDGAHVGRPAHRRHAGSERPEGALRDAVPGPVERSSGPAVRTHGRAGPVETVHAIEDGGHPAQARPPAQPGQGRAAGSLQNTRSHDGPLQSAGHRRPPLTSGSHLFPLPDGHAFSDPAPGGRPAAGSHLRAVPDRDGTHTTGPSIRDGHTTGSPWWATENTPATPAPAAWPTGTPHIDHDLAAALARVLHDEADLRGLAP